MTLRAASSSLSVSQAANLVSIRTARKWGAAAGKAKNGTRNARIMMIGDSTMAGAGSTGSPGFNANGIAKTPFAYLASELNKRYTTASAHAWFGSGAMGTIANQAVFDPRLVFGAGWQYNAFDGGGLGFQCVQNSSDTSQIQFTPTANVDTFVIWYIRNAGFGTLSWAINAGGATNVSTAGAAGVIGLVVPAGSLAANTLKVARVSGDVFVLGMEAYDSTTKQIQIMSGAISGATTSSFVQTSQPWSVLNQLVTTAPDLTIIQLQTNDCINNVDLTTYTNNLTSIYNYAITTGDVVFVSGYPSQITYNAYTTLANQQRYRDAMQTLASSLDCTFIDIWQYCQSYETMQAVSGAGMYADSLHPTGNLYAMAASYMAGKIATIV